MFAQKWVNILLFFLLAWLLSRAAGFLSGRVIRLGGLSGHRSVPERRKTLYGLVQGIIIVTFFGLAVLLSLSQFVETTTLIWMIGLFGAGFGLSARSLISDVMTGTSFIFEDTFAVSEKVEILGTKALSSRSLSGPPGCVRQPESCSPPPTGISVLCATSIEDEFPWQISS